MLIITVTPPTVAYAIVYLLPCDASAAFDLISLRSDARNACIAEDAGADIVMKPASDDAVS